MQPFCSGMNLIADVLFCFSSLPFFASSFIAAAVVRMFVLDKISCFSHRDSEDNFAVKTAQWLADVGAHQKQRQRSRHPNIQGALRGFPECKFTCEEFFFLFSK